MTLLNVESQLKTDLSKFLQRREWHARQEGFAEATVLAGVGFLPHTPSLKCCYIAIHPPIGRPFARLDRASSH